MHGVIEFTSTVPSETFPHRQILFKRRRLKNTLTLYSLGSRFFIVLKRTNFERIVFSDGRVNIFNRPYNFFRPSF